MSIDSNIDSNWVSAVAAVAALIFSGIAGLSAWRSRIRTGVLEAKATELAERQTHLAHQRWSDDYFREITNWACQVCTAISRAIHLVGIEDEAERRNTLVTLSACVDMGRWYFPNLADDDEGKDKEPAYQGVRQPVLDWIVLAYDVCAAARRFENPKELLVTCQRNFVSAIQEKIDPRSRDEAIRIVLQDFGPVAILAKISSPPN